MLNPVLRTGLIPEYRLLYDLKLRLSDESLKDRIAASVKHIRKVNSRNGENKLEAKLKKFGNNGEFYFTKAREKIKNLYKVKPFPTNSIGLWRSIEFELIFKSKEAFEEFKHAARLEGVAEAVTIHEDKSIKTNHHLGIDNLQGITSELIFSYRAGEEDNVRKFCKALKGRAYVNRSCGTHFHLDMRQYDEEKVTEFGNRVAMAVPALRLLLPKDRRENKFCQTVINTTKTECINCHKLSCNCHVQPHKYAFINLAAWNKHKTMEIRGHSGTLNAEKILNWIKLVETIMLAPMEPAPVTNIEQLIKNYKLDDKLAAYVRDRAQTFEEVRDSAWGNRVPRQTSEQEEKPADVVEVPIHPAFLAPVPKAKQAQAAPQHAWAAAQ